MEQPSQSSSETSPEESQAPTVGLWTMFRLGLFQMGLGIMSLLTLGVLNRLMIDELKVPALIAAGAIAMHQFVSPARLWFGQMSDAKPIFGRHRTGYVWVGAALFTTVSFLALEAIWQLGKSAQANGWIASTYLWAILLAVVFAIYGLALSASSTPFAALLVDVSDEENRSQLVSVVWSMLMVGIVIGALISSKLLHRPEVCGADILTFNPAANAEVANIPQLQSSITPLFILIPAVVFGLCIVATVGVEDKFSRFSDRALSNNREDSIGPGAAWQVLTASRQTGLFFSFLLLMTISLFMQDAVLEPFGGEVFGLCISETTQLNAFFGTGTLLGIGSTGFTLVPRIGKQTTTKLGCILSAICFGFLIVSGFSGNPNALRGAIFLFGLSSGVLTAGAISLMLDLTAAQTAGTFIGAWGLAQAMARGLSTVFGGAVLDAGRALFGTPVLAYSSVFAVQAVGLTLAVLLLKRVNIQEFQDNTKQAIAAVLSSEIED
jgi:BCD family chlorophyll transporter-like MFS transporter